MSDIFALDADGASSLEDDVRANPLDPAKLPPPMWQGAGDQLKQLVRPSASAGRSLMMAAAPFVQLAEGNANLARKVRGEAPTTELTDSYFKDVVEGLGQDAIEAWTPNAATSGSAAKTLGTALSVAGSLPQMLGLPAVFLADAAIAPSTDTIRAGGDTETALRVGALSLGVNALGFRLPAAFGSTFATRVATGAGSNVLLGVGQNAGTQALLEGEGLTELAASYDPFNAQSLTLDTLMGAAFGYVAHVQAGPRMAPSERAAVLAANNADHFTNLTMPGEPLAPTAAVQHQAALETAIKQVLNGERVDVASVVDLSQFTLRPELEAPPIATAPAAQWQAKTDTATAIKAAADEMGIDAVDLATVISYETGGTFDPDQAGPTTKWGQHRGLIQFGEPQRAKYGVREGMTVAEQMPAVIAYLRDAGVKPGMSILDVYSAINAGGVGRYNASDTTAGGAPGTVRDKVEGQMAAHRRKAQGMFRADPDAPNFGQAEWPRTIDDADPLWQAIPEGANGKRETANIDTPEREALRASLVDEHFASLPDPPVRAEGERPIVYVMGGGGGAGKGTILKLLQAEGEIPRGLLTIDPDAIKAGDREHGITGIPEYADMAARGDSRAAAVVHEESSQVAGRVKARGIAERRDMVLDRTLGDPDKALTELRELKAAGYDVQLYGVTLDPAEALDRAGGRAARTGRYVPNANLLTAHKGFAGGFEALVGEVTTARLYDNGGAVPVHIASGQQGALTIHDQGAYNEVGKRSQINENATTYRSIEAAGADPTRDNAGAVREGTRGAGPAGGQPGAARDGAGQEAPAPLDPERFPIQGEATTVVTERGLRLPVRYAIVDVATLVTSHDNALQVNPAFPVELQPRDRARAASEQQITRIANNLDPELLGASPKAADGAPIVGAGDSVVESGNARTIAVRRAYTSGKADDYRAYLVTEAARFGLDPAAVDGVAQPMLVRVATGDYDRADFARQANESTVAAMSTTEQAMSDAQRLPDLGGLRTNDDGTINMGGSAKFVAGFIEGVGPNERSAMATADGQLSQQGQGRIRNAVFARAYGDADLVAMMAEATDANVKNVLAGMLRAAPGIANLREMIAEGGRFGPDIAPDLVAAVRKFSQLRSEGLTVEQFEAQGDFFGGGGLTPKARDLLRTVGENARAPKRFAEFLQRYVDAVETLGDPRQADLMGGGKADPVATAAEGSRQANDAPAPRAGALFGASGRPTADAAAPPINGQFTAPGVTGDVIAEAGKGAAIYGWSGDGTGGTRAALAGLRNKYGSVEVHDPGEAGTESRRYWEKMASEGRIDRAFDDDGQPVSLAAVAPNVTPANRAAYEAIADMPDLKIIDEDGNLRLASEILAEGDAAITGADETTRAIDAATNCLLRNAA